MKLALGTVQFGIPYGIANTQGRVRESEVGQILSLARGKGIDLLDTASAYGESESVLGRCLMDGWRVVTKIPSAPGDCPSLAAWVESQVRASLERLGISRLHAVLLHHPQNLLEARGDELYAALSRTVELGLAVKTGFSIYDPCELDELLPRFPVGLVQAPFHVLDRRMITSGWMTRLAEQGIEIHARSIFLQGLLLMPDSLRSEKFSRWSSLWLEWSAWLATTGMTPLQACLRHALSFPEISRVVIGVDSLHQLEEICDAAVGKLPALPAGLWTEDIDLLNPSRWAEL